MVRFMRNCISRFTAVLSRFVGCARACILALCLVLVAAAAQAQSVTLHVDGDDGLATPTGNEPGETWENAYLYLLDAIDRAESMLTADPPEATDVEIWVKARANSAAYYPDQSAAAPDGSCDQSCDCDREASFLLLSHVELRGGFDGTEEDADEADPDLNRTILSGDLCGNDNLAEFLSGDYSSYEDNSLHVVLGDGADDSARIDGFTITAGNADVSAGVVYGGGILLEHSVEEAGPGARISRCVFEYNLSSRCGGALYCSYAPTEVRHCLFYENRTGDPEGVSMGGAAAAMTGLPGTVFVDCDFIANRDLASSGQNSGTGARLCRAE